MLSLAQSCCHILQDQTTDKYLTFFGKCFVDFCCLYGYDKILRVAGRHYRDFLNGIDNLHETIRFSYPKLQSPSFIVECEDAQGCVLTYRSKRHGFKFYVIGQLKACAMKFYDVDVDIVIIDEGNLPNGCYTTYRLNFNNVAWLPIEGGKTTTPNVYPALSRQTFFKVCVFTILLQIYVFLLKYDLS